MNIYNFRKQAQILVDLEHLSFLMPTELKIITWELESQSASGKKHDGYPTLEYPHHFCQKERGILNLKMWKQEVDSAMEWEQRWTWYKCQWPKGLDLLSVSDIPNLTPRGERGGSGGESCWGWELSSAECLLADNTDFHPVPGFHTASCPTLEQEVGTLTVTASF